MSVIFLYLSYDEAAQVHERLINPMRELLRAGGVFYFAWVIPATAGLLVIGAIYLRFVLALPPQVRKLFVLSAAVYVSGAFGTEMVGGYMRDSRADLWTAYQVIVTIEETLELLGMMLFSTAILKLLARDTETSRRYFAS